MPAIAGAGVVAPGAPGAVAPAVPDSGASAAPGVVAVGAPAPLEPVVPGAVVPGAVVPGVVVPAGLLGLVAHAGPAASAVPAPRPAPPAGMIEPSPGSTELSIESSTCRNAFAIVTPELAGAAGVVAQGAAAGLLVEAPDVPPGAVRDVPPGVDAGVVAAPGVEAGLTPGAETGAGAESSASNGSAAAAPLPKASAPTAINATPAPTPGRTRGCRTVRWVKMFMDNGVLLGSGDPLGGG